MIDSVDNMEEATEVTKEVDKLIGAGEFVVKKWIIAADGVDELYNEACDGERKVKVEFCPKQSSKVLGVNWNPATDQFYFKVKVNFSPRRRKMRTGQDIAAVQLKYDGLFMVCLL